MAAANTKTVIGLTGNIATGKSVVRRMMEHLGAYGIDADALTHRVMSKGAPGYQPVVDQFGKFVLDAEGEIDRRKLAKVVFSDPEALANLETIVHPFVRQAVEHLIGKASQDVIVVEAIKLLESPLRKNANWIWVTTSSREDQITRLAEKRGMDESEAVQRMAQQSSQAEKIAAADVIIENHGSFDDTWKQVQTAWNKLFPGFNPEDTAQYSAGTQTQETGEDLAQAALQAVKGGPRQAEDIAELINRLTGSATVLTRMDVMAVFGEKAYMLLVTGDQLVGAAGWQVENLVACIDEVWLEPGLNQPKALGVLIMAIEDAARQLQAEASLAFVSPKLASYQEAWSGLGYESRPAESLKVHTWQEAARELRVDGTEMLFKQLRVDRVLRPL